MTALLTAARRLRSAGSFLVVGATVVTVILAGSVGTAGAAPLEPTRPVDRVLIVSIPNVGWTDLAEADAPNLRRLLAASAVANLTARNGGGGPAAGYLTLGAGKRALGTLTPSDGMGFGADDRFGDSTAADAFRRRTGRRAPAGSVVDLGIVGIDSVNAAEAGGSSIGALGTALRRGGWTTAVIGNGDGSVPDDLLPRYRRYVVGGIIGRDGTVDAGRVDAGLLEDDPAAPFGVRLDNAAVVDAFTDVWTDRVTVLVEASDLARAAVARVASVSAQDQAAYRAALARSDALVGDLLEQVDPAHDAVVVVSPAASRTSKALTVVGVRAPGVEPALMRSPSTRRTGFVLLADVAPTVLQLAGLDRPTSMNGRPFALGPRAGDATHREHRLVRDVQAALFRDRVLIPVTVVTTVVAGLVAIAAVLAWELRRRRAGWRTGARLGASWLLAFVPLVFVARLVPFHSAGVAAYWAFVAGGAAVLAALSEIVGRRRPLAATTIGLAVIVALLVGDLFTGARLQLSTAFGYTPSIGVRFSGVGNVAFAFLGASAVVLAGLLAHRWPGRRGTVVAAVVLALVLVADAAPMLGGDVGGVLSLTPAFLVTVLMLARVRIRPRTVAAIVGAVVVAGVLAGVVDLLRPAKDRTHLGRLLANTRKRGLSEFTDVVLRKATRNLDTWTSSAWRVMFVIGLAFLVYLLWRGRPRVRALVTDVPELRAALTGFAVLAVLGYAVNDSGAAIPAVMAVVFVATLTGLLVRRPDPEVGGSVAQRATDPSTAAVRAATSSH